MTTTNDSAWNDRPEPAAQQPEDERMTVLGIIDNRLKNAKVMGAVISILDAIQAAKERESARLDTTIDNTALRVTDLRDLITAAIAEPGSVPTDSLVREAGALSEQASARDMQPIWELLSRLEDVQPTPPPAADVAIWADHLCYVSINMRPWEHMQPAAKALFDAGLSYARIGAGQRRYQARACPDA